MSDNKTENLEIELIDAGASAKEAGELSLLSKNLNNLYNFKRKDLVKEKFLGKTNAAKTVFISRKAFISALFSIILLLGITSVVSAQGSLPGDPLYPVKRLSENMVSIVNPAFKGEILKRRSQEIEALSNRNNPSGMQAAIRDYENTLSKNEKINPSNINESRDNLEEAQQKASGQSKKGIQNAIRETERVQEQIKVQSETKNNQSPNSTQIPNGQDQNKVQNQGQDQNKLPNQNQNQNLEQEINNIISPFTH